MRDLHTPSSGPPSGSPPDPRILAEIGEEGVRRLVRLHYDHLLKSSIAYLFPPDPAAIDGLVAKTSDFFIQIMGGPALFSERYGPPRMRARHMPFEITEKAKDVWLECFYGAMDDLPFPEEHRANFLAFLEPFAGWMVNSVGDTV